MLIYLIPILFSLFSNSDTTITNESRVIHVFVALCDNKNQGIVPVPAAIGNGQEAALAGWLKKETPEQIRTRAAEAYHKYQKCGVKAASKLLVTGW